MNKLFRLGNITYPSSSFFPLSFPFSYVFVKLFVKKRVFHRVIIPFKIIPHYSLNEPPPMIGLGHSAAYKGVRNHFTLLNKIARLLIFYDIIFIVWMYLCVRDEGVFRFDSMSKIRNQGTNIFRLNIKNCITTSHFYAISCDQKSVLSYLSLLTLTNQSN